MSGARESYVDTLIYEVMRRVPEVQASTRSAEEVADVSIIELLHPDFSPMDLVVATDAKYVKVMISRFVFDAVLIVDLGEFAYKFFAREFELAKGRFLGGYRLRVTTGSGDYEAFGPRAVPLEDWESRALV